MSLLEDVFLQDEASEAQELERIIEGDEYDDRPRGSPPNSDDNSEKEDEAEEDKRHVEPTSAKPKRVVKNPRVILNPARLVGPRGIQVIPEHFKDFKFKGKGHEKEDLDIVLKKLEHWAYRLFPKFQFADCLKKIETLGKKRPVMVHLTKIRSDQYTSMDMDTDTVVQRDSSDEDAAPEPPEDEFDKLLQQQIELARATPARTPAPGAVLGDRSLTMPKATSSPSINEEQRERMLRNRQMAEERRLARLKQNTKDTNISVQENLKNNASKDNTSDNIVKDIAMENSNNKEQENIENDFSEQVIDVDAVTIVKNNRSNVIDSSDDDDALVINESVSVDVHNSHRNDDSDNNGEIHSDLGSKNINTVNDDELELRIESNDAEMDEIGVENQTDSHTNDAIEKPNRLDNLETVSDIDSHKIEEINKNKTNSEKLESNDIMNDDSEGFIKQMTVRNEVDDTIVNTNSEKLETNNTKNDDSESFKKQIADSKYSENNINSVDKDKHNKRADRGIEDTKTQVEGKDTPEGKVGDEIEDIMDVDFSDDF